MNSKFSKLIVEIGFSAVNYGLCDDIKNILIALPYFIKEREELIKGESIMLFSLGLYNSALVHISSLDSDDESVKFQSLINSYVKDSKHEYRVY